MSDLIKREDVIDPTVRRNNIWDIVTDSGGRGLTKILASIPAVDAVPVKHGWWTRDRGVEHDGEMYCSVCGQGAMFIDWREEWKTPYCPNCGAKMDGGEQDGV